MGVAGQHHAPAVLTLGKAQYPMYRRLGWPMGRSAENLIPPGFKPQTVQPVDSHYTDHTINGPVPNLYLSHVTAITKYLCVLFQHSGPL